MTAARNLTDADVEAIADAVARRLVEAKRRPSSAANDPPKLVSEVDKALAKKYARRAGMIVTRPRKR